MGHATVENISLSDRYHQAMNFNDIKRDFFGTLWVNSVKIKLIGLYGKKLRPMNIFNVTCSRVVIWDSNIKHSFRYEQLISIRFNKDHVSVNIN